MGSVTGSAELVILEFCAGNGGMSELSSWLAFLSAEESAVSVELFSSYLAWIDWTEWCHAGELDFGDICGHQLQLCSCAGLYCLQ